MLGIAKRYNFLGFAERRDPVRCVIPSPDDRSQKPTLNQALFRSRGTFGPVVGLILLHERYRCRLRPDRTRY